MATPSDQGATESDLRPRRLIGDLPIMRLPVQGTRGACPGC